MRNHFAVNSYALAEVNKVRRCVKPCLKSSTLKNGSKIMGAASFTVGSSNMNRLKGLMRMVKEFVKGNCVVKTRFIGSSSHS